MLNRVGTYMYWNNTWLVNFNQIIFFNKLSFLENIFFFIFSEKIFQNFFEKKEKEIKKDKLDTKLSKDLFFKKIFLKKIKKKNNKVRTKFFFFKKIRNKKKNSKLTRYNFTKFWFIKYNQYLLISSFVFFYFKIKANKKSFFKKKNILKSTLVFWKKRKGDNLKKKLFSSKFNKYLVF